ncbi:MAG TPA: MBL fold metallo-hydrolase [Blastocatellia bacterium]|jgi:glyoxylase-like metal-dependent hydrolase (beta-lactamase superfamily II)/8-oxo-dGTP pyrophosphatase MutT (NUDIX family)|nr:MBL fold metallo-hydrolase [Blastocatellia bacterium]
MSVTPRNAAAIILLKDPSDPKVFWVKRSPKLAFMGGFHSFPGGQLDKSDEEIRVGGCDRADEERMRVCAVRELLEEAGVLVARGAAPLSSEEIARARRDLEAGTRSFQEILEEGGLKIDRAALVEAGRWITPAFAHRRYDTCFYLSWLPEGQEPSVEAGELEFGEWIRPADALIQWKRGEIMMAPPTLHIIRTLAANSGTVDRMAEALMSIPEARQGRVRRIEFRAGMFLYPLKTPTLPPATHTNCYIIGGGELIVIDPASPYEEERHELDLLIDSLLAEGRRVREIFVTHHHHDHVAGVDHFRKRLGVPVAAHRLTAERLSNMLTIDRFAEDNEVINLEGDPGWRVRVLHTPGHTRGHLCFFEERSGALMAGDLIAGVGTVVIDPPEGNMNQYYASLNRLLELPNLSSMLPAHGPAIGSARNKIEEYIRHRNMRENRILDAVREGAETPAEIVEKAYTDVSPAMYGLAERSTLAHLEKLQEEGRVSLDGGRYRAAI